MYIRQLCSALYYRTISADIALHYIHPELPARIGVPIYRHVPSNPVARRARLPRNHVPVIITAGVHIRIWTI